MRLRITHYLRTRVFDVDRVHLRACVETALRYGDNVYWINDMWIVFRGEDAVDQIYAPVNVDVPVRLSNDTLQCMRILLENDIQSLSLVETPEVTWVLSYSPQCSSFDPCRKE